jgi:hypothetical protein
MGRQPLRAYWAEAATQNWGDVIAPIIIERFAGEMPVRITEEGGRFLTVGTLIQPGYLKAGDHIWGSGYNYPEVIPKALDLTFYAGYSAMIRHGIPRSEQKLRISSRFM